MKVGVFHRNPAGFFNGNDSYHASLIEGFLNHSNHEVVVVRSESDHDPSLIDPIQSVSLPWRRPKILRALPMDWSTEVASGRRLRRAKIDVLIASAQWPAPRPQGIPRIEIVYEPFPTGRWGLYSELVRRDIGCYLRRNLRGADAIIAISEHAREGVEALGVPVDRIAVAPPAVREFAGSRRLAIDFPLFVLHVGWFHPRKDLPLSLRAWQHAVQRGLAQDLVLVGHDGPVDRRNGSVARRVLEIVDPDLRKRVHVLGQVTRADLGTLYEHASAVLVTSIHEGFGIPVIEALSVGTPVVVVDRASLPEAADAVGRVVPADAPAVGDELLRVVRQPPEAAELQEYASEFTVRRQVEPFLEALDRLAVEKS